jgi:chitodextrinase
VSEFSFDRVTVTTNETSGRDYCTVASSNVSWNFFDETGVGGAGGMNGNGGDFVPYTGEMVVVEEGVAAPTRMTLFSSNE